MTDYLDAATIASKTTPSIVDIDLRVESSTVVTQTVPSVVDILYRDAATISTKTSVISGELEFVHPTGQWGAFDLDSGAIP